MSEREHSLLNRTLLQPGESLQSLLIRLTKLNYYDTSSTLSSVIRVRSRVRDKVAFPRQAATYYTIVELTHLSLSKITAASGHHFASVLTPPGDQVETLSMVDQISLPLLSIGCATKQLRPAHAAQFCPRCLRESAYHRLIWMPIAVSACLRHQCLLLNLCPTCHSAVSIPSIVGAKCVHCAADLRSAEAPLLDTDTQGIVSQHLIQSLLSQKAPLYPEMMPPLSGQPPRTLYRLLDGLQWAVRPLARENWTYFHHPNIVELPNETMTTNKGVRTITSYESYCLYATAHKGIINWPDSFWYLLDAYRAYLQAAKPPHGGPKTDLGNLYTQWLQEYWQHPAFEFVHKAFEEYFAQQYSLSSAVARTNVCKKNVDITEQFTHVNITEAARLLGTTPRTIDALIKSEKLSDQAPISLNKRQYRLLLREDILKLRDQWNEEVNRDEAAKYLGVSEKMIIDLVQVGLLPARRGPAGNNPQWMFSRSELARCLESISKYVYDSTTENEKASLLDLPAASKLSFVVGVNAAMILAHVAEGKLRAYLRENQELALGALLFNRSDISNYVATIKREKHWVSRKEVTQRLKVKDSTLTRWVKAGLIFPVQIFGNVQYFNDEAVEKFIAEYITSEEAAKLLGMNRLTIQKWARIGWLATICASGSNIDGRHSYLFSKTKLIQWRNERLTFGEAARLLGVSKATLHRWVIEEKVEPLYNGESKQRWFLKQEILRLKLSLFSSSVSKTLPP